MHIINPEQKCVLCGDAVTEHNAANLYAAAGEDNVRVSSECQQCFTIYAQVRTNIGRTKEDLKEKVLQFERWHRIFTELIYNKECRVASLTARELTRKIVSKK